MCRRRKPLFEERRTTGNNDPGDMPGGETMPVTIEVEQEADGRWLAEVRELPGVLAYGTTRQESMERAEALALRVLADRLEHGESVPRT